VAKLISIAVIIVITIVNVRGTRGSATVENWTTSAKVGALFVLSLALIAIGHGWRNPGPLWPATFGPAVFSGAGTAMIGVLWAYEGWQYVTFSAGETKDPQRVFPRAIAVATFALIVLYVVANAGYIAALGPAAAAQSDHVAADASRTVLGSASGVVLSALVLVSIFSATNGLMMTAPRLYYSMARDGVFFARLATVSERFGTPAAVLAISGTFEQLLTYVVFAGWIFYGLGALSIFASRRKHPDAIRPFRTPGYPITPILFVASAAALVLNTLREQPQRALIGLSAVVIGTPAFYLWRAHSRRTMHVVAPVPAVAVPSDHEG
jgi:APA family basic amino acid/polyamine antiporter